MSDTRSHIMMVSLRLFLQKNYKEVTLQEIVAQTGMSKGAFYHYFQSKERLFYEIIDHFFSAILNFDFASLPSASLYEFYHAYASEVNARRLIFMDESDGEADDFINLNFFALLFDAFKMFPEFRERMEIYHQKELGAWVWVIGKARKSGEIRTPLTDEQVAQIFLFTSDGLTMNLTMAHNTSGLDKKLASLWDNFYQTIKV